MKKGILVLSLGYWFSAYSLGLLIHPYKTVRELIRMKKFRLLILVPVVMWGLGWVIGILGLRFGGGVFQWLGWKTTKGLVGGLAFLWWWATWFLGLWQAMLGYLLIRFGGVLK